MNRKLEIGPSEGTRIDGDWVTLNSLGTADYKAEWGTNPLPFDDNTFSLVYASHVLEHIPWFKTIDALQEVHRILQPGGVVEIWVPNFEYLVECYLKGTLGDDWRRDNPNDDPMLWFNGRLFTYGGPLGLGDPNWHRAVFDGDYLRQCLLKAGFSKTDWLKKPRGHDHGPINLGMSGTK